MEGITQEISDHQSFGTYPRAGSSSMVHPARCLLLLLLLHPPWQHHGSTTSLGLGVPGTGLPDSSRST